MEDGDETRLMVVAQSSTQDSVIGDLEHDKMEVLNANANIATLNMQNYVNSEYQARDDMVITAAGDGGFEPICVEGDATTGPINALIQQEDGQFLQVDSICGDGEIYLTTTNGQQLAYIVTQPNDMDPNVNSDIITSNEQKQPHDELPDPSDLLTDHIVYDDSAGSKDVMSLLEVPSSSSTIQPSNTVKTQLVSASSLAANAGNSQSFRTVSVTLVNGSNEGNPETNYILLMSNDEDGANPSGAGNVISITEHKAGTSSQTNTPKSLLFTQQAADTLNGSCSFCDYKTTQRHLLHKHIKTHSEERPHKCHICSNGFKTMAALNNHVNTHSGTRPHKCKSCDSAFTTSGELIRHIRYKHTFEKPHKCPQCEYAAVELSKMKRHIRTHTGERPYQCSECAYASPDSYKLKRHMRTHTGEKPYACSMCTLKFTQSNSLKAHMRIHMGSKPVFQCQLCPATCGRKTDLRIHMQKLHSQEKVPLECRKCHKTFDSRYNYKLHIRSHDGERTFQCVLCPFATLTERKLTEHLIVQHENHTPYKCTEDDCGAAFRFRSLLRRHKIFLHGSEDFQPLHKTFECTCGKKFVMQSNQLKHQDLHAGNSVLYSTVSVLQSIEDIDDIGEEIITEVCEEIAASNPMAMREMSATALPPLPTQPAKRKYSDTENSVRQRIEDLSGGENMVMRRIVKEVKGHRVVVMEVGPSELHLIEGDDEIRPPSMLDDAQESRMSGGDRAFVSGSALSQDAAVEILYNLAAENTQGISEHRESELTSSLSPSERVVTLEMETLPDNVMSESVQEVIEENVLEDNDDQSNLEQISLSVQAASTTLMQLKRSAMEQQVEEQERDSEGMSKRPRIIGENDDIHS